MDFSLQRALTVVVLVSLPGLLPAHESVQKIPVTQPELRIMERDIWRLLNEERALDDLPLLKLSVPLSDVARKHSQDMADRDELSHFSASGKTLADRLAEAGILYIEAGENVAKSETFMTEFINEGFVESLEHRENILDPDFEEVGIGIVHIPDRGYYITQNFLDPLIPKREDEVRTIIQKKINSGRNDSSLPPLVFLEQRDVFAQNLSKFKAQGSDLPPIPDRFGETMVIFLATATLSEESVAFPEALDPRFDRAALGTWFAQTETYPGGSYFLTLMLFASNRFEHLSLIDLKEIVLSRIDDVRSGAGRKGFAPNSRLNDIAEQIVEFAASRNRSETILIPQFSRYEFFSYGTEDLQLLPEPLKDKITKTQARQIGIGLQTGKDPENSRDIFWVAIVFD